MSPWILWRAIHLKAFFREEGRPRYAWAQASRAPRGMRAIAGWGYKQYSERARAAAKRWDLPYWALEDGFLRSQALGVEGAAPLSMVVDPVGIYYEADRPSLLENLIQDFTSITPEELADARELMAMMRLHKVGKYNNAADLPDDDRTGHDRPLVLVIDQTLGDYSVKGGRAGTGTFEAMLEAAFAENPGADVRVRVHPDVLTGKKESCLLPAATRRGALIDPSGASMASLLARTARVYVATSQAGLEALIHNVPVTCFGMPFYAGWGLTEDRQSCPRRVARPSLEALVAAAYLRYCRYIDPLTGGRTDALTIARHLARARSRAALMPEDVAIVGAPRGRRRAIRAAFAKPKTGLRFLARGTPQAAGTATVSWGSEGRVPCDAGPPPGLSGAPGADRREMRRLGLDGFVFDRPAAVEDERAGEPGRAVLYADAAIGMPCDAVYVQGRLDGSISVAGRPSLGRIQQIRNFARALLPL